MLLLIDIDSSFLRLYILTARKSTPDIIPIVKHTLRGVRGLEYVTRCSGVSGPNIRNTMRLPDPAHTCIPQTCPAISTVQSLHMYGDAFAIGANTKQSKQRIEMIECFCIITGRLSNDASAASDCSRMLALIWNRTN